MQPPHDTQRLPAYGHQPQPGHQPAGSGPHDLAAPQRRRRRGPALVLGLVGVLVLLVVLLVGGEFASRSYVHGRIEKEASAALGTGTDVDLGSGLVLPSLFTHSFDRIHLTSPGSEHVAAGGGLGGTGVSPALDITGQGVRTEDDATHIDSMSGTVRLTDAQLTAAAAAGAGGGKSGSNPFAGLMQVQSIHSNPAQGTLDVSIGGLANAVVKPRLNAGKVQLDAEEATIFGVKLPANVLGGTVSMMDDATGALPKGVEITGVKVVDGGLLLDVSGRDVVLPKQ